MMMTSGSDNALCGRLLLIDADVACARQTGEGLAEALLVAPRVTQVATGRSAVDMLR